MIILALRLLLSAPVESSLYSSGRSGPEAAGGPVRQITASSSGGTFWGMSSLEHYRAIKFATKHTEMISSMCHGVRLVLLIPKLFLFSILDLAKLCL